MNLNQWPPIILSARLLLADVAEKEPRDQIHEALTNIKIYLQYKSLTKGFLQESILRIYVKLRGLHEPGPIVHDAPEALHRQLSFGLAFCQLLTSPDSVILSSGFLNPVTPNIKEQVLLSCPHTFLIEVLGRSY